MFYHHLPLYYKFELKMFRANHLNNWRTPRLLNGLKCESKLKTAEEQEVRARSLACSALRSRRACWRSEMWLEKWQALTTYTGMHKTNTRWLVHNQSTFSVRTNHGQTRIHNTHHDPDLGEATTFPLIVYLVPLHEAHIQMVFFVSGHPNGSLEIAKVGTLAIWEPHNFVYIPLIEMRSKAKL